MPDIVTLSTRWLTPAGTRKPTMGAALPLMPAGELWDAVRTSAELGDPVLDQLRASPGTRPRLGPVIRSKQHLYWLITRGATNTWPSGVRLLTTGSWIAAPAAAFAFGSTHWAYLPDTNVLSGPAWLAAALDARSNP